MRTSLFLIMLALLDMFFSYVLFNGQQYFSFIASLGILILAATSAILFVLARRYSETSRKISRRERFAAKILAYLSVLLIAYEAIFSYLGTANLGAAATSLTIIVVIEISIAILAALGVSFTAEMAESGNVWETYLLLFVGMLVITALIYFTVVQGSGVSRGHSDELAFNYYASQIALKGQNPYAASMLPALNLYYAAARSFWLNGTTVNVYDYPAFSFLSISAISLLSGTDSINFLYAVAIFLLVASAMIVYLASGKNREVMILIGLWFFMAFYTMIANVIEYLAISLLLTGAYLYRKRPAASGGLAGLAASTTQLSWFAIPFLSVFVLREQGKDAFSKFLAASALTFLIINGYYLAVSPEQTINGMIGTFRTVSLMGANIMQLLIHPYPVALSYSLFISVLAFALFLLLLYFYADSLKPLIGIAPVLLFFLSWDNNANYFIPFVPYIIATSYYELNRNKNKVKNIGISKKMLGYGAVILFAVILIALIYSHSRYLRTNTLGISNVSPVPCVQNGTFGMCGLNVQVFNNGNSTETIFFRIFVRNPDIFATASGSILNSSIEPHAYRNFTVPMMLPSVDNSTRIFILAFSSDSIASKRVALQVSVG